MSELHSKMTALADAVREKAELTDTLTIDEMTEAVNGLAVNGVDVDERTLTVTPSKSQQNFTSSELGENAYYVTVTVNAIPDEYITTTDATADASNILEGKTAYINGVKVTGAMINHGSERIDIKSGVSAVSIDAPGFYSGIVVNIEQPNTTSLEITPSKTTQRFVANDGNVENGAEFFDTVTVKAIPDEYITTDDATAVSGDILEGKTAYVRGKKITGTASGGGAVSPMWGYGEWKIRTNRPPCNTYNVPSRGDGSACYGILDGDLIKFDENPPVKFDETINWTYVSKGDSFGYTGIGDGKLFNFSSDGKITPRFPSLSGIVQVSCMTWGTLCCTGSGELYGGGGNDLTKVRRVEYTRENGTDPIVYVNVSKILNCPQDYQNFWVITADGSLAHGWLDKDSFDHEDGVAYAEIDSASVANGNPFVNYYPQASGEYSYGSSVTCELAFRADGLWYRQTGKEWRDNKYWYNAWTKAIDPGLRKTDWLGYCSLSVEENWETGETSLALDQIALHIDEQGRLWKLVPIGQISGYEITMTGLSTIQVGEDTDWQCVTPVIRKGQGQAGRYDGVWGQKGGKVVNIRASDTNTIDIAWDEYPVPIPGKMICAEGNNMYFAPEGAIVDLSKAGGTY